MPIKGTCLLKDTPLKEALFDIVEFTAYERLKAGKNASLSSVFSDIRKAGVEVDLPTIGEIYQAVTPRTDANFDSDIEIEDFVLKTFNDSINNLIPATEDQEGLAITGQSQIGKQKPEAAVVEFLLKALFMDVADDLRTTSDMKKLQDALWKGMQRKLGKLSPRTPTKKDMADLINESLGWEKIGIVDVNGKLNSITDLFNSMRNELAKVAADIRAAADPAIVERFNEYVKNLENATYTLLFTEKGAKQVRNEALINVGFGKKLSNGKEILDWNKLAKELGSVSDIREQAEAAFLAAGYPQDVVERLKDTLVQEFLDLRTDIVDRQHSRSEEFAKAGKKAVLEEAGLNELLGGKTMAAWIKDQQVETVEDLERKAYDALTDSKYVPVVQRKIVKRLTDFFNDNYAKVNEQEAKRAINDILGEQTIIEWIKANGIQNQQELNDALDTVLAPRDIQQKNIDQIKGEFNRILDINQKAERELRNREARAEAEYRPKKSDLRRLIELYHLGVFNSTHDRLLYEVVGVDSLKREDLQTLENIAAAASDLARRVVDVNGYNLAGDFAVARRMQFLQREIDAIVARNISNKKNTLKIGSFIANFVDLMLTGLLAHPTTMIQNIVSGWKARLSGVRFGTTSERIVEDEGKFYVETSAGRGRAYNTREEAEATIVDLTGKTKQSLDLYWSMLKEVSVTGQAYGEEIGSFATRELFSNTLRWKWGEGLLGEGTTLAQKAKSILFAYTLPARIGLLAFDSANKVALTNSIFYNMIFNSLVKQQGIDKDVARAYMNEMLYGQKFEEAKVMARKIIVENNKLLRPELRSKVTEAEVVNLANDVVKANLATNGSLVDTNVLEAALKGSYHVAGLGLGHEPNNFFSKMIKGWRDDHKQKDQQLVSAKDWKALAVHRMTGMLLNGFVVRFAGGATNWLWLRAKENLGLGILWGGAGMAFRKEIDWENLSTLQRQMRNRENDRNNFARSLVGTSYTAITYAIGAAILSGRDDDEEEKELAKLEKLKTKTDRVKARIEELKLKTSIMRRIKQNTGQDRLFRALAPDLMLIQYYMDTGDGELLSAVIDYTSRTYYGNDRFSVSQKLDDARRLHAQGDKEGAKGVLMSILGDRINVPFWRAGKEYYRIVTNLFKGDKVPPAKYQPATTWQEGLLGGGALQDLGIYRNDARITLVPGVGPKSYEKFKAIGIETMSDLKDGWWNRRYKNEYILDADERRKAEQFYKNYKKTK